MGQVLFFEHIAFKEIMPASLETNKIQLGAIVKLTELSTAVNNGIGLLLFNQDVACGDASRDHKKIDDEPGSVVFDEHISDYSAREHNHSETEIIFKFHFSPS